MGKTDRDYQLILGSFENTMIALRILIEKGRFAGTGIHISDPNGRLLRAKRVCTTEQWLGIKDHVKIHLNRILKLDMPKELEVLFNYTLNIVKEI